MSEGSERSGFVVVVVLALGVAAAQGCGSVTSVGTDGGTTGAAGTGSAGRGAAGTGTAGTGAAGTGVAGTTAAAGTAGGAGRAGTGTAGTTGAAGTGAAGTSAAGRAGTGTAGTMGAAGTGAAGTGAAGTNAGNAGTGAAGTGAAGTFGAAGTSGTCTPGFCPPLAIGDLENMDTQNAPGFNATGFRCKALSICRTTSSCVYFASDTLGHSQSAESYMDGAELQPAPVKLYLHGGAASQCGNPKVTLTNQDTLILVYDGGRKLTVYLPAFEGTELTLYIASDGSTFTDVGLKTPARLHP